ncbi:MAG: GNAT family N-acetyltransferase [Lachnospiraceae bacterium]|jgi:RimJ/RimL family protein N-acetyltransferase|nr:hypothetical protein C819_01058 [Lachnospiraceae bacterium 10-1]MCX4353540.1 GNAT family N-acetyltransferase [Lachnospiraceae bacterium]
MQKVYETCPVLENEKFILRLIQKEDAGELLKVYSDEKAVPFFNSDNCHGADFHFTTMEEMEGTVKGWLLEYENGGFVRWSVLDKATGEAVGTIELFHRNGKDYFNDCGILRLDLRSDYEEKGPIAEILGIITEPAFELFECSMIATKAISPAEKRRDALKETGYCLTEEKVIGHDGSEYGDYWVCRKSS